MSSLQRNSAIIFAAVVGLSSQQGWKNYPVILPICSTLKHPFQILLFHTHFNPHVVVLKIVFFSNALLSPVCSSSRPYLLLEPAPDSQGGTPYLFSAATAGTTHSVLTFTTHSGQFEKHV